MVSKGRAVAGHGGALRGTGRYLNGLGVLVAGAGVRVLEGDLLILAAHAHSAGRGILVCVLAMGPTKTRARISGLTVEVADRKARNGNGAW